jgi:hypothetical protein
MAEEIKNAAPTEEYNDDGGKNPDYVAPAGDGKGADAGTEKKDEKKEDEEEVFNDTIDPVKPPEIPTRKFNSQQIIARKNEKIKKLESKLKEGDEGYVAPEEEEEDEGPTDEHVEKIVQKTIAPLLGKLASDADEAEFQSLVKAEPDAAKYTNHIKAYMAHDAYKGVSPTVIYHHLAWTAAQALGAKRKKAADLDAAQHKSGGRQIIDKGTVGDFPSADEISEMSDEDFKKFDSELERGRFSKK